MKIIQFTVPHRPLSENHIYGYTKTGRKYMKAEGKELMFRTAFCAKRAMQAGGHKVFAGPFSVTVVYFMIPKNECDVSNCEKALLDAMEGIVYVNDKQNGRNLIDDPYWSNQGIYYSFTCRKFVGACVPHIDVTITYY